ncbi:MAG: hypothetical protein OEL20_15490 [Sulfuritalea sp.]|nr:hypothetical protein [Sulfuritalea sp.]
MLIFTNRQFDGAFSNEQLLTRKYAPFAPTLNCCEVSSTGAAPLKWKTSNAKSDLDDENVLGRLRACFAGNKAALVFIHGNNNEPNDCFTRCKELEDQYGVSVIGYSWTSEGFNPDGTDLSGISSAKAKTDICDETLADVSKDNLQEGWINRKARRYAQAKINAQHSGASLARFLRLVASARLATMKQPFSVAVHSLGCHFMHYAIEHDGASESLAVAHNVALIAGCTGAAKHVAWVGKMNPVRKIYITYTIADSVVAAARVIDGDIKLGADPGSERLPAPKCRYVDFEGAAKMKLGAHRYFVADPGKKLSKEAAKLFERVFQSLDDIERNENVKNVYPLACSPDGTTCYMGMGSSPTGIG